MYIFDTTVFYILGHYYPSAFPTIWNRLNELVKDSNLLSVKEALQEIDVSFPRNHVKDWIQINRHIFKPPNEEETKIVLEIFKVPQYQGLVKKENILKGRPVADPFIIAAAKVHKKIVVTHESYKHDGARIPTVCKQFNVRCIDLEKFFEHENMRF